MEGVRFLGGARRAKKCRRRIVTRMHMPTVSAEQKRLNELFTGTWRGEETLHPSDWDLKGGTAFGTWVVHPSLDGFCLLVDYTEERGGKILYRGHGIHGFDAQTNTFCAYWFDNIGVMPKAPVQAKLDGNRYSYTSDEGPQGWTKMTYEWKTDTFEFRIDKSKDGGATWSPMHEGRYSRAR
jgi:hypothetical protein